MCQVGNTKLLEARGFTVCLTTRVPTFAVGDPVECRYRKFDGRRHHGATVRYLGEDEHGVWMGEHAGNAWSGGPRAFVTDAADVLVVPKNRAFVAMFYRPHPARDLSIYADITTVPEWSQAGWSAVDLDLDVCRRITGEVFVDDEDEFAEHRLLYGYPDEIVALAEEECSRVAAEMRCEKRVFAPNVAEFWLRTLEALRS